MHITLFTFGSRGDTQPFVALALRLMQEGHRVKLAAPPDSAGQAAEYGVDFASLGHSVQSFLTSKEVTQTIEEGQFFKSIQAFLAQKRAFSDQLGQDVWKAVQGAEAIIYKNTVMGGYVYSIAEALGLPCAEASFVPMTSTREFPPPLLSKDQGPLLNWLLGVLIEQGMGQLMWQLSRQGVNKQRRSLLGQPPLPFFGPSRRKFCKRIPIFYAYSTLVLPRPTNWPDNIYVPGYWFLDPLAGWQPPVNVLRFLEQGPAPVSISFGSMPLRNPAATLELVLEALQLSGQRGLLLGGWAGIGENQSLPEQVMCVESLPHSWLFPRLAAIVHHGGAGTTGAALRSGVPSIVTPFFADQPFWAQRVSTLGVGPAPLPYQSLTARQLANAIDEVITNITMRTRATEMGERLQKEDGVGRSLEIFSQYVTTFGR